MRNLKRALSLGLTAAMISGLMVMGSSAASYADVTSEDNVEAIEVLQTVGIMVGDENGDFNPDQNVTRNEMAVIMSNLMEYNVASYKDTSPFTDVPSWAEPYVAACYTNGITAGTSATTYGGSDTVTTAQAALMLMKALGYFQYAQDFGADWQLATVRQGNAIDLFVGVDSGVEQAMTRNDVAQLVLNTLKSGTVQAETNGNLTVGNVTIATDVKYNYITSNQTYATAIDSVRSTSNTTDAGRSIVELGEQLYMGDLKLNDNSIDDFGRPSRTWSYDGKEVGTYAKTELLVESYTTAVTGREMYDLLTAATINDNDVARYVDGYDVGIEKTVLARNNKNDLLYTGNGALTEVYLDDDHDQITIATINTYLAQATGDYSESKEYAPLEVFVGLQAGNVDTHVYNVDEDDVAAVADVADEQFYLVNISLADADAVDDYRDGTVVEIMDPEVMENSTVTKWSDSDDFVVDKLTVDGTEYKAAEKAFYDEDTLDQYDHDLLTDMTYTLYVDQYGYVIGVDLYEGDLKYVFITGYDRNSSNLSVSTADAGAIFLDGTMEKIEVNVKDTNENIREYDGDNDNYYNEWTPTYDGTGEGGYPTVNRWYQYSVNESGVYTLKPTRMTATLYDDAIDTDGVTGDDAFEDVTIDTANVSVRDNVYNGDGSYSTRVYGEDESVYITVDTDLVDTTDPEKIAITDVDGVYTGVQSIDLEVDTSAETITGDADYFADDNTDYDVGDAIIEGQVYTVYDKDNYIIGAVVMGDASGSVENYAYILSDGATSEEKIGDTYYWEFDAVLDGEIQTLTAKSKYTSIINTIANHQYEGLELRFDSDGYVIKVVEPEMTYAYGQAIADADIEDYDVYFVTSDDRDATPSVSGDYLELNLQGRTLYITPDQDDAGLALASDAKAVVVQPENGKNNVKTEFTTVKSAISHLADALEQTTALEYKGEIFAVLNSNGSAAWVVFYSDTELHTGDGGVVNNRNSITRGDVTLTGIDNNATPESVRMTSNGNISYSFSVAPTAPSITRSTTEIVGVQYDETIKVNGRVEQEIENKSEEINDAMMVYSSASVDIDAGDEVIVEIRNVTLIKEEQEEEVTLNPALKAEYKNFTVYTNYAEIAEAGDADIFDYNALVIDILEQNGFTDVDITFNEPQTGIESVTAKQGGSTWNIKVDPTEDGTVAVVSSQETLDAAIAAGKDTIAYLGDGTYSIDEDVTSDLTIIGNGDTEVGNINVAAGDHNVTISGVDFTVNSAETGGEYGLNLRHNYVGNVSITDCEFTARYGVYVDDAGEISITRCIFNVSVCPFGWTSADKVTFLNNTVNGVEEGAEPKRPYLEDYDETTEVTSDYPLMSEQADET